MPSELEKMEYAQKACQQYITALPLNAITFNVIQNRKALNALVIRVINQELTETMKTVKLTDPSLAAKIGWAIVRTGLQVGLNAVTMGLGGAVLNEIHDILGTHGSSIFELNKQMITIPGTKSKTAVRSDTNWSQLGDASAIGRQILSDISDIAVNKVFSTINEKSLSRVKEYFCLEGKSLGKVDHDSALMKYYAPCDILQEASQNFENKVYSLCIESIGKIEDAETMKPIELFKQVKEDVDKYFPLAHIADLNEALKTELNIPSEQDVRKIFLAEVFWGNADKLLTTSKTFSDDLWKILQQAGLISNVKTDDMVEELTGEEQKQAEEFADAPQNGTEMKIDGIKMHKDYKSKLKDKKCWEMIIYANKRGALGVSNKEKFGESSSLATIICSVNYLEGLRKEVQVTEDKLAHLKEWTPSE